MYTPTCKRIRRAAERQPRATRIDICATNGTHVALQVAGVLRPLCSHLGLLVLLLAGLCPLATEALLLAGQHSSLPGRCPDVIVSTPGRLVTLTERCSEWTLGRLRFLVSARLLVCMIVWLLAYTAAQGCSRGDHWRILSKYPAWQLCRALQCCFMAKSAAAAFSLTTAGHRGMCGCYQTQAYTSLLTRCNDTSRWNLLAWE